MQLSASTLLNVYGDDAIDWGSLWGKQFDDTDEVKVAVQKWVYQRTSDFFFKPYVCILTK